MLLRRITRDVAMVAENALPQIDPYDLARQQVLLTSFEELADDTLLIRLLERYADYYYWRRDNVVELQGELQTLRKQTLAALGGRAH